MANAGAARTVMCGGAMGVVALMAVAGDATPPLYAFGLPHQPLGAAVIGVDGKGVLISGIGAQSEDGVEIVLGAAEGWKGEIDFGPAGALPPGARVDLNVSAQLEGQLAQLHLTIQETSGGLAAVSFDAGAACEPCSLIVEALLDGKVVDSVKHPSRLPAILATGALGSSAGAGLQVGYSFTKLDADSDANFALHNPAVTPITLTGSSRGAVDADTIALRLNGLPPGIPTSNSLALTAANLMSITIANEALVQFHAEHRAVGVTTMAGDLDAPDDPNLVMANFQLFEHHGVSVCCHQGDLDGDGSADSVAGVGFDLAYLPTQFSFFSVLWTTNGSLGDGSTAVLSESIIAMSVSGGRYFWSGEPEWMTGTQAVVTIRHRGVVTAQGLTLGPGTSVWATAPQQPLPDSIAFELLPPDETGVQSYKHVFHWDTAIMVQVVTGGPSPMVAADEVEVLVSGHPDLGALEVTETILLAESWPFARESATFIINDETFVPAAGKAKIPADLNADGDVDGFDLALLLGQWTGAKEYAPCPPHVEADLNSDCKINGFDLALLLGAWG